MQLHFLFFIILTDLNHKENENPILKCPASEQYSNAGKGMENIYLYFQKMALQ